MVKDEMKYFFLLSILPWFHKEQAKCRCSLEKKSSRKIRFGNDLQFGAVDADELFDNYSCLKKK